MELVVICFEMRAFCRWHVQPLGGTELLGLCRGVVADIASVHALHRGP